jgi:hypothetical protein
MRNFQWVAVILCLALLASCKSKQSDGSATDFVVSETMSEISLYPNLLPVGVESKVNVTATISDPRYIQGSIRVVQYSEEGANLGNLEVRDRDGNVIHEEAGKTLSPEAFPLTLRLQVALHSPSPTTGYLVLHARFAGETEPQNSYAIPIEFASRAVAQAPSAVLSPSSIDFLTPDGRILSTVPLVSPVPVPFVGDENQPLLRITTDTAFVSDDLSRAAVITQTALMPDTSATTASEDAEAESASVDLRIYDANGQRWTIALPANSEFVGDVHPFDHEAHRFLTFVRSYDTEQIEIAIYDDNGKKIYSLAGQNISPVSARLSHDGRLIAWQGQRLGRAEWEIGVIEVINTETGAIWDFPINDTSPSYFTEIPGQGFSVVVNGKLAATSPLH